MDVLIDWFLDDAEEEEGELDSLSVHPAATEAAVPP